MVKPSLPFPSLPFPYRNDIERSNGEYVPVERAKAEGEKCEDDETQLEPDL